MLMAMGIKEMKEQNPNSWDEDKQLQYFLDRFYISRIGIRMLITQHSEFLFFRLQEEKCLLGRLFTSLFSQILNCIP